MRRELPVEGQFEGSFPRGLKPELTFGHLAYGLKPVPFTLKPRTFRAEARTLQPDPLLNLLNDWALQVFCREARDLGDLRISIGLFKEASP